MARPPRHQIELSDEERRVLERVGRSETKPFREVQRARIVLYAAEGLHDTEIASRLDTTAGIVGKWRRRFAEQRLVAPTHENQGVMDEFLQVWDRCWWCG
jgi:transposase-like protein